MRLTAISLGLLLGTELSTAQTAPPGAVPMTITQGTLNDPDLDAAPLNVQNTPTIADLGGGRLVAAYYDLGSSQGGGNHRVGYSWSSDDGSTWTDGGKLPDNAFGEAGDPVLARHLGSSTVYLATLGLTEFDQIPVFKSTDFGHTWSSPVNGAPGYEAASSLLTKQSIAVDNFAGAGNGNIYLCASRYNGSTFEVRVWRSTDGGTIFTPNLGTLVAIGGPGCEMVVSANHQVNVFYIKGTGPNGFGGDNKLFMRRSINQGVGFGPQVLVADLKTTTGNGDLGLLGGIQTNSYPHAAASPSAARPNLYAIYNDDPTPPPGSNADNGDIFMVRSINNGVTWSAPVRVSAEASGDQYHPDVAFLNTGEQFLISYYSRDPAGHSYHRQIRAGYQLTNGSWGFNTYAPVSPSTPPPDSPWIGEWDLLGEGSNAISVVWSDQRERDASLGNQSDIRFARITLPPAPTNLVASLFASPASIPLGKNTVLIGYATAIGGAATDVNFHLDRVPGLTFQSAVAEGGTCEINNQNVDCFLGTLPAGTSSTVYTVATGVSAAGTRVPRAVVSTSGVETNHTNNADTVNVTVSSLAPLIDTYSSGSIAIPIPDGGKATVPIPISDTGTVIDITARVRINHTMDSDLTLALDPPHSVLWLWSTLSRRHGGSGDNYGTGPNSCAGGKTVFDDEAPYWIGYYGAPFAGAYIPDEWLANIAGGSITGTWKLNVYDREVNAQTGVIGCVELLITRRP